MPRPSSDAAILRGIRRSEGATGRALSVLVSSLQQADQLRLCNIQSIWFRSSFPVPTSGMTGDGRAAKRAKLSDNDAKPDSFAQGDLTASNFAYGGFETVPLLGSIDSGRGWDAAGSLPTANGPLPPLTATDYFCSPPQMPTMGCYPGMVRPRFLSVFWSCQVGKKVLYLAYLANLCLIPLSLY